MAGGRRFEPLPVARELGSAEGLRLDLVRTCGDDDSPWGVPAYIFTIVFDWQPVGRLSLRVGATPTILLHAGHLGFTVEEPHRGRGFAGSAARLVLPLAKAHDLDPLWITCTPDNRASIRTIESLGATYVETVPIPAGYDSYARGERQKRRYRLDLELP